MKEQVFSAAIPELNAIAPASHSNDNIHVTFSQCCRLQRSVNCFVMDPAYFNNPFWHSVISNLDLLPMHLQTIDSQHTLKLFHYLIFILKHNNSFNHLLFLLDTFTMS